MSLILGDRKLRILMVADVSPLQKAGGSARVVREQIHGLDARGHSVRLLSRNPGGEVPQRAHIGNALVCHYPVSRKNALAYALTSILGARSSLRAAFMSEPWDVVVYHQPFSAVGVQTLISSEVRRIYCFYSPAGVEYRLRAGTSMNQQAPPTTAVAAILISRLERLALSRSERIIVLSEFSRQVLEETHGEMTARVVQFPGGVDLHYFHPATDRESVRKNLGLLSDTLVLLTVRDLEPRMGLDRLLKAIASLKSGPPLLCIIGGTGPLQSHLEALANDLGISKLVRFMGHIPERQLPLYYQAADLFVLPTTAHEGFGLVTVEALACGTPVLATPVGATPEILAPLDRRLLTEDASVEALAAGINRAVELVIDSALRQRCRDHAAAEYSWQRHVSRLESEMLELCCSHPISVGTGRVFGSTQPATTHKDRSL